MLNPSERARAGAARDVPCAAIFGPLFFPPAPRARDHGGAAQEFAEADWEANDEDAEDEKLWEDDWDDDDADDEFVVQLREELNKTAGGSS